MDTALLHSSNNQTNLNKALDFAQVNDVDVDILRDSSTSIREEGTLYSTQFVMENALSMAFYFSEFRLPEGCGLFLVTGIDSVGAFTHESRWSNGDFQTRHVQGGKVQIQMFCSSEVEETPVVKVAKVATAYRVLKNSDPCNIQAVCTAPANTCNSRCRPTDRSCSIQCTRYGGVSTNAQWASTDWDPQRRSTVAVMSRFGSRYCSGNIINNANREQLVLTAAHCSVGSSDLLLFGFFDTSCTSTSNFNGDTSKSVGDLSILASNTRVDNTLLRVGARIPTNWNVYLAGYDTTSTNPSAVICLSHPAGSNMKIAHSNSAISKRSYFGSGTQDHWFVSEWTEATTEGGSSGSALFDRNTKRIIGQLHGGSAACPAFNGHDLYGGLFESIKQSAMSRYLQASSMNGRSLY
jgi:hypothetical protein